MRSAIHEPLSFSPTRGIKSTLGIKATPETSLKQRRGSILLVDDDQVVLACLESLLAEHFHITAVTSFAAAREKLNRHSFDVVMTDYELPDAPGLVLLEQFQSKYSTTIGILLTAHAKHPLVQRAQSQGHGLRVILKPYDPATLLSAIKTAVSIATMRNATQLLTSKRA